MKRLSMNVKPRAATGKRHGRAARRQGLIPAIIYGAGKANVPATVAEKDFRAALRSGGAKAIIDLNVEGEKGETLAIIKEIQYDALGDEIQHVDFYRITTGKPIQVTIPVTASGRSEGEKEGGIVEHLTREVRVECLPQNIPEEIPFDISLLDLGQSLHLKDVTPPPGVAFLDAPDTALVVVKAPRMARAVTAEEEAAEAEAAAAEAAELEGEKAGEEEQEKPPPSEASSSKS